MPLQLTLCTPVDRETTHCLEEALQEHLDMLREKGFNPVRVHCEARKEPEEVTGAWTLPGYRDRRPGGR